MGMTIDNIIQSLIAMKSVIGVNQLTINEATDIMRKYQKIEEIVNTWRHDITAGDYHCMAEVAEVFEDGEID